MRRLVEYRTAALCRVEFFGPARSIQEVRVVDRIDHTHTTELSAPNQRVQALDRSIERMAVSDHKMHARFMHLVEHLVALVERQGHRFFDEQVLAMACGENGMLGVMLMRSRHVNGFNRRVGAQFLDSPVACGGKLGGKLLPRFFARVGRRYELNARIVRKGRQHDAECPAETGDPETKLAFARFVQGSWPVSTMSRS